MAYRLTVFFTFTLCMVSGSTVAHTEIELYNRLTAEIGGNIFKLSITRNPTNLSAPPSKNKLHTLKSGAKVFDFELLVTCKKCMNQKPYSERVYDTPIGVFRLWDGSPDIITIWGSGSAYKVRVYNIVNEQVSKTFDRGSSRAPQFVYSPAGALTIILTEAGQQIDEKTSAFGSAWRWDTDRFVKANRTP